VESCKAGRFYRHGSGRLGGGCARPGGPHQKAASADGEIVVTWVERGAVGGGKRARLLRVFEPHVIGADDLRKEAAFVLPFDPAVRVLSAAISAAIPGVDRGASECSASAALRRGKPSGCWHSNHGRLGYGVNRRERRAG